MLLFHLLIIINNVTPSAFDVFAESATEITSGISKNVPIIGNAAISADSICTTRRAGINFYYSPNPVLKAFFGASCLCRVIGASSSSIALITSFTIIPLAGWLGSFGARGFNGLGKYPLDMGNITSDNITNPTNISEFMSQF